MSIAAHHAEWLSLVDVSGPFLSVPVLVEALPNGLDAHDPFLAGLVREALDVLGDASLGPFDGVPARELTEAWVRFVLGTVLEFDDELVRWGGPTCDSLAVAATADRSSLRPDAVLMDGHSPRLLLRVVGSAGLDHDGLAEESWSGSERELMVELLRAADCRLGLVTDGERWTLVSQGPNENPGFATWWASLWREERITLQSFRTLLGEHRFFAVPERETPEGLLDRSAEDQREITTKLGAQTLDAVEILVRTIDRIDRERGGVVLAGVADAELYDAAVTVMMRLIFLFFAEENDLLPVEEPLYVDRYAATTLRSRLQESADQFGEEILETTSDAWPRLLALWRAVYAGLEHAELRLVPYGGSLFDPDRFPFLEGRRAGTSWSDTPADPLPVDNRTVLHLLHALQTLDERGHRRKLSFRSLDVEQIGHVYEGMLDHTATRSDDWVLGLSGTGGRAPEVPLATLDLDDDALVKRLKELTGRQATTIRSWLAEDPAVTIDARYRLTWRSAFGEEPAAAAQARRFAKFVRPNSVGAPTVVPPGSVYVCDSAHRGATGTHYTPRSLTEEMVTHTLEPLVYRGPAEGRPEAEWELRPPAELWDLTICDPACGSGAFLVQACRYLADKIVESRRLHGELDREPTDDDLIQARRLVAERCLHGVDINPMACEMAKLSLWLITLGRDRPFTFVDHAIRCGDSLLGITSLDQLRRLSLDPTAGGKLDRQISAVLGEAIEDRLVRALRLRAGIRSRVTVEPAQAEVKAHDLDEADEILTGLGAIADRIVAVRLSSSGAAADTAALAMSSASEVVGALRAEDPEAAFDPIRRRTQELLDRGRPSASMARNPFHWPLEFPHAFAGRGGFDAVVGNPPFLGGQHLTGHYGVDYREFLVDVIGRGRRGSADLVAYFFLRSAMVTGAAGSVGLLATNTIAQGDTREVGLDQLLSDGWAIRRAVRSRTWPGVAALEIAQLWLGRGWAGPSFLDGVLVSRIRNDLRIGGRVDGDPFRLQANSGKSFIGSYVLGMGFVLDEDEARSLIDADPRNAEVVQPYLNGQDLNSRPDQSPSRWVINFRDWDIGRAQAYPAVFEIIEQRVQPERAKLKGRNAIGTARARRWWNYASDARGLYDAISALDRVLVVGRVSRWAQPTFIPTGAVMSDQVVVFPFADDQHFGLLSSSINWSWVAKYASTHETRLRYTPSDCFDTFPMPPTLDGVAGPGGALHRQRSAFMASEGIGLTATYNRIGERDDRTPEIARLRDLHVELDLAVRDAYGWNDLDLDHDFHDTDFGRRFTLGPVVRQEVLDRLLELNHRRHEQEVDAGLGSGAPAQMRLGED